MAKRPVMSVRKVAERTRYSGERTRARVPRVALRSEMLARTRIAAGEGHDHGDEDGAHAHDGVGEAEELDKGGGEDELPDKHGCGPAGVEDVAGGGEGVGHYDVGPSSEIPISANGWLISSQRSTARAQKRRGCGIFG